MNKLRGIIMKTPSSTRAEGDQVIMKLGNLEVSMPYRDAFKLSQMLRVSGKEAKRNAGDIARHWSVLAVIDDANASP